MTRAWKRMGILPLALSFALAPALVRADTETLELSVTELEATARRHGRSQRVTASYDEAPSPRSSLLMSGGAGVNLDPNGLMLGAQLEFIDKPWLFYGPFVDLVFADGGSAFTGGVSLRSALGGGRLRPSVEAGIGLTLANLATSSLAFHFHFAFGAEYRLTPTITLASMFKPTFNPPVDNFWISWPILIGRFAL